MTSEEILVAPGGFMPAFVFHEGHVRPQIHGHGCAADRAVRHQRTGNPHILLHSHHLFDSGFVIIGLLMAGFGALPEAIVALGAVSYTHLQQD